MRASADVNDWFVPLVVIKPTDTDRTAHGTPSSDPDLQLAVDANAIYEVSAIIKYDGGGGGSEGDILYTWNVPSGASFEYADTHQSISSGATTIWGVDSSNYTAGTNGTGTYEPLTHIGILTMGSTAGNLVFAWAKNTAPDGTNTHVRANSFIRARRIG